LRVELSHPVDCIRASAGGNRCRSPSVVALRAPSRQRLLRDGSALPYRKNPAVID
jgi:hypothetical protein